jgi:hypothetical protein
MQDQSNANTDTPRSGRRRPRHKKLWATLAFVLLGLGVTLFLTLTILTHRASGILRSRIINTLSTRFDGRVELPSLEVSAWRGFEVEGKGLKVWTDKLPQKEPLFAVDSFQFHTMWWNLLRSPMHVGTVQIRGLAIHVPPKQQRGSIPSFTPPGERGKKNKIEIVVDHLEVDQARLVFGNNKPGKDPMVFLIHSLSMQSVGRGRPMHFHAILVNPKPIGNIDSAGSFGPFNVNDLGSTPVSGDYTFSHADLNSIHGIGGMLSSTGKYAGELDRIVVDGKTDTPNFSLDVSGHQVPLKTTFHAIVDGTNGDTYLQPVDAWLNKSHIVARGSVQDIKGKGHLIRLQVMVGPQADIGDMLNLAMKMRPPLMHGRLNLATTLVIPPGSQRVAEKMELKGSFLIKNATFPDASTQKVVDELSLRGSGKPKEASQAAKNGVKIASDMRGDFSLANGKLTVPSLDYQVPGAHISMHGLYTMDGNDFNFAGHVRLQAKISDMVSGWWKKLLLMPVDPIFAGHGVGTDLPIKVSGDKHSTHVGLDIGGHTIGP